VEEGGKKLEDRHAVRRLILFWAPGINAFRRPWTQNSTIDQQHRSGMAQNAKKVKEGLLALGG
jgi:hypothetical protein